MTTTTTTHALMLLRICACLQEEGASAPVQAALPRVVQSLLEAIAPDTPTSAATLPQARCPRPRLLPQLMLCCDMPWACWQQLLLQG